MIKMEKLVGEKVKNSAFKGQQWIADLIYHEGPYLSLFRGDRRSDLMVLWVDCDNQRDRWVSFDVGGSDLSNYLSGSLSLKELIDQQAEFIFFHTANGERKNSLLKVYRENFPDAYQPSEGSYWDSSLATEDTLSLIKEKVGRYDLGLDGESWYVDDLSSSLKIYRQLYAFHYALSNLARKAIRGAVATALSGLAWRGGFSTVNWYKSLHDITPIMHRLRIKELRYASPGHIALEVIPSVSKDVASAVGKLGDLQTLANSKILYSEIYAFLRKHGLISLDARDIASFTPEVKKTMKANGVFDEISRFLNEIMMLYGVEHAKSELLQAGAEELGLLKAMLGYHRRAIQLAEYVADGSLQL